MSLKVLHISRVLLSVNTERLLKIYIFMSVIMLGNSVYISCFVTWGSCLSVLKSIRELLGGVFELVQFEFNAACFK